MMSTTPSQRAPRMIWTMPAMTRITASSHNRNTISLLLTGIIGGTGAANIGRDGNPSRVVGDGHAGGQHLGVDVGTVGKPQLDEVPAEVVGVLQRLDDRPLTD